MTKIQKESANALIGTVVALAITAAGAFIISQDKTTATEPKDLSISATPAAIQRQFEEELAKSLSSNHEETIAEFSSQNETLARIEDSIKKLEQLHEKAANKEDEKKEEGKVSLVKVVNKPTRVSSTRWTVEGKKTYSDEFLAAHLAEDHGIDPAGYSREDMQTMHDNLHNGFSAMGNSTAKVSVQATPTYTVRPSYNVRPTGRVFRTYRTCPTGGCP